LKGYQRLTLEPGEERQITFRLPVNMLAFYGHDLNLRLEPGEVEVMVGSSSEDIRLSDTFEIAGKGEMPVEQRVFRCPVDVD
jgi:beta-glucosidase